MFTIFLGHQNLGPANNKSRAMQKNYFSLLPVYCIFLLKCLKWWRKEENILCNMSFKKFHAVSVSLNYAKDSIVTLTAGVFEINLKIHFFYIPVPIDHPPSFHSSSLMSSPNSFIHEFSIWSSSFSYSSCVHPSILLVSSSWFPPIIIFKHNSYHPSHPSINFQFGCPLFLTLPDYIPQSSWSVHCHSRPS